MQYLLMIYSDEKAYAQRPPDVIKRTTEAYLAYADAIKKAGADAGSARLQPTHTATTVRVADGKTQVLNGPYADTKEQLGGYFLIDVPDLDAALSWAARCPGAQGGVIEVRPIWAM
ncbi:MAG TPA: YciI family protein [Myxococcota bacterium]|nr:YciI family protein [Myxococcota bacterium]